MSSKKLIAMAAGLTPMSIALAPQIANACVVCGLDGDATTSRAFKHSVLFMISVPYLTFMIVGGIMYMAWRKARRSDSAI